MSIEIIGRAVLAPGAETPEQLFEILRQRRCMITRVPADRWDQSRYWHPQVGTRGKTYTFAAGIVDDCFSFDAAVFGLSQREAQMMDPQQRMILHLTWRAFESANIDFSDLRDQRVGVYVGASALDHGNLVVEDPAAASPYFMTGNTLSIISNRISHVFGLIGPSLTVDTACSSSLVALDLAVKALEAGEVDTAIVGGVNGLTHPLPFVGFAQARMLSPEGLCRAYDNDGQGYVRAEGGSVLILRRSDVARAQGDRSFARILATGVNSAGRTNGISLPSEQAQARLLRAVYQGKGIDANRLAFIEGHGTGTKVGDPAEVWSIGTVVGSARRAPIPIGSIKTNIGHTEPASGLMGLMKAMLALEHNYFPASLHFETPNEAVDFNALNIHVCAEPIELLRAKHPRLAGVNSFGFGGTNAHVVISDPEDTRRPYKAEQAPRVFLASAHTASALESLLASYSTALGRTDAGERRRLLAAAGANRHRLRHRFVVASDNPDAIAQAITAHTRGQETKRAVQAEAIRDQAKIAFVFSGNGSQWAGMGVEAYRRNTAFRDRFNVIHALFQVRSQISLIDLLLDEDLGTKLHDTKIAQPLLFAIQAALADVLALLGVRPDAVYGHSVGEVAAAYVSGAISLVDAVSVVAKRSFHQDRLAGMGKMAAIQLGPSEALSFFRRHGLDDLVVAATNAKNSTTASGPVDQIEALRPIMKAERIVGQVLDIDYPFHHPMIEVAKADFLEDMAQIALRPTQIPFISTVSGGVLAGTALDPEYWWRNVREPVDFLGGTAAALEMDCTLFVEIGPRPILTSYLRDTIKERSVAAATIPSLVREESSVDPVSTVYSRIIANGGVFDGKKAFGQRDAEVTLPALPFEAVDLRHEFTSDSVDLYGRLPTRHTLAGWRVDPSSASWKNHIDAHLFPDFAEHVVDGKSILPGSAFLEIAIAAAREFLSADQVEISNLEILHSLELSTEHLRELSTTISRTTGDIEIKSRDRLSRDEWTVHAVARCRKIAADLSGPTSPRKGPARRLGGTEIYETARRLGLEYGPNFQLLREAIPFGEGRAEIMLKAPRRAGNPFVGYSLHPISVDAVFHGLLGVFGEMSGDGRGAPYVPVRIGSASLYRPGETVSRALIGTRRVTRSAIRADFRFLDEAGQLIASFEDCRFKRTYLRQRKPLSDVSYHSVAVPSALRLRDGGAAAKRMPEPLFPQPRQEEADSSSQLLEAAVFRASHDIAMRLAKGSGVEIPLQLPGDADFQRFLSNCLNSLGDVGLAEQDGGAWSVMPDCALPPVRDILEIVYKERPERIAEIVAINDVHRAALDRLRALEPSIVSPHPPADVLQVPAAAVGERTFEMLRSSAFAARFRVELVRKALEAGLRARPDGTFVRRVVELGSVSASVTAELASLAAEHGAFYTVIEPRPSSFEELSLAFERNAHVSVARALATGAGEQADLVISAADHAFALMSAEAGEIAPLLAAGTRLLLCLPESSAVIDFVNGLSAGWFDRSAGTGFPIGRMATLEDWNVLLSGLRMEHVAVARQSTRDGAIVTVEATGTGRRPRAHRAPGRAMVVGTPAAIGTLEELAAGSIRIHPVDGHLEHDRLLLSEALAPFGADDRSIVALAAPVEGDGSEWLVSNVMTLGMIAAAIESSSAAGDDRQPAKRLAVVLPAGGDLHVSAAREGLRAYLRVLRNEFPGLEVHTVELSGAGGPMSADRLSEIVGLVEFGSVNREWAIDPSSGEVSELRIVPGPTAETLRTTSDFPAATLRQGTSSQINSLRWEAAPLETPGPDEVLIAVAATGLNFRDVMWAMGMLPEEALEDGFAGPTIGMECAGEVIAVGSAVTDVAPGDRVMAVAPAAFGTHVRVRRSGVAKLPAGIDPTAGATLPVAFLTAYYALVELGRLRQGETVLIHGAAGGVGLAALQIARARGARVIATAGALEKRRLLEMLGADHVFNSRSLDFVHDVLEATGGEGVDVVLNSLFAEAMERSLSLLKPFGRFLELGKRDFYSDTKIGLRPFRRNVSYFGIDADQLLNVQPQLSASLLTEISDLFAKGELSPLPYRAFEHDEVVDAFRLMQASGHIGKIVVRPPVPGRHQVGKAEGPALRVDPAGIHLVLGGIGGFGLRAANWLVEKGARGIALCSRRGKADEETAAAIARWKARGVTCSLHACDITDEAAVQAMLAELRLKGPLKSVVHAAMVLDDGLIESLTEERVRTVVMPKARAAAIFDRQTRADRLDNFILFSSATTLVGNPGQGNYVAANGYLDGLARARRRAGLPALSVGFGAISDAGFLTRNAEVNELLSKRIGKSGMTAAQALSYVDSYVCRDPGDAEAAVVSIAEIDMGMARNLKTVEGPLFEVVARSARSQSSGSEGASVDLAALVEGKSQDEGERLVFQIVAGEIAAILRIPASEVSPLKVIKDIGLDSLMAMELGMSFRQKTGFEMPLSSVTQSTTVGDVSRRLYQKVVHRAGSDADDIAVDAKVVDHLAALHATAARANAQ